MYGNGVTTPDEVLSWFKVNLRLVLIVAAVIVGIWAFGVRQSALNMEENVLAAKSIISINQNTLHNKIPGMVQLIERGAERETAMYTAYALARNGANLDTDLKEVTEANNAGNTMAAYDKLSVVMEAIPTPQSIAGYSDLAKELSLANNNIKDAQVNLTTLTASYRQMVRGFPTALLLKLTLYHVNPDCMAYLDFGAAVEEPITFDFAPLNG